MENCQKYMAFHGENSSRVFTYLLLWAIKTVTPSGMRNLVCVMKIVSTNQSDYIYSLGVDFVYIQEAIKRTDVRLFWLIAVRFWDLGN